MLAFQNLLAVSKNKKLKTMENTLEKPVTKSVDDKKPIKKMMLILSKATIDSVYACFILANGARMEGIESEIFFTFFGLEAITKRN